MLKHFISLLVRDKIVDSPVFGEHDLVQFWKSGDIFSKIPICFNRASKVFEHIHVLFSSNHFVESTVFGEHDLSKNLAKWTVSFPNESTSHL